MRVRIPLFLLACLCAFGCSRIGHYSVIQSLPSGASVVVDGRQIGLTPAVLRESGKLGHIYGVEIVKDGYEPVFDALRVTETETRSRQWNILWRIPGVKRVQALPDNVGYVLRHPRWRFAYAPFVSDGVVFTKYDPNYLLPEATLRFEYTKEFQRAAREFLGDVGHVVHFRAEAVKSTTFPFIFGFVQGGEDYVAGPGDLSQMGVFVERVTRLTSAGSKAQQKAFLSFKERNPWLRDAEYAEATIGGKPGGEKITMAAMTYRPANEEENLGAGDSLGGWVVLPESFDLEEPITVLWGDETAVKTFKLGGNVEGVRPDGVLVLKSAETVKLAGVKLATGPETGDGKEAAAGRMFLESMLLGENISLELGPKERNVYGDLLCYVYLGDSLVNEAVVEQGLARVNYEPDGPFFERLVEACQAAKVERRGLWGDPAKTALRLTWEAGEEEDRASEEAEEANEGEEGEEGEEGGEQGDRIVGLLVIGNDSGEPIDLKGYTVFTDVGPSFQFPTLTLPPEARLRLHSGRGADAELDLYWESAENLWEGGPVMVFLCDSSGTVVDVFAYAGYAEAPSEEAERHEE